MSRLSYDSVNVLIYDPVPANRTATRATMYALGFRRTETVSTLEDFIQSVQKNAPDIALCEAQGQTDELCAAIQQMRQGGAGRKPRARGHRHVALLRPDEVATLDVAQRPPQALHRAPIVAREHHEGDRVAD